MEANPKLILLFAACFAFFLLAPPFLGYPFGAYPLISWADVLDIVTPLVLIPLYWLLFTAGDRSLRQRNLILAFLVFAAVWSLGHGIHLAANSINNLLGPGESEVHELVHFFDENLSHYLWHIAIVALSIVLMWPEVAIDEEDESVRWLVIAPAAVLSGFTYFAIVIEGGTVPFGLIAAILIPIGLLLKSRIHVRKDNLTAFFFSSYVVATLLFSIWLLYWRGFPEFTETGII